MSAKAGQKPDKGGRHGSVRVPIYRTVTRTGISWVAAWYEGSQRKRKGFSDESEALTFATRKAKEIALHGGSNLALTGEQLLVVRRAMDAANRHGVALDVAMTDWAQAKELVGNRTVAEVAREWWKARPVTENPATDKAVEKFIAAKESARRSDRHVRDLRERLDKFASAFRCCIADVTTAGVETWLQSLDVGPRSRRNYLGAVASLAKFAERRGWISRGALDLSGVERAHSEAEVQIFTPDELRRLLDAMRSDLIPFVALGAFAGLRTAEIQRLDWSEVGPEFVDVKAAKAKTRSRRFVPVLPALAGWLAPHRKKEGPVCPLVDVWHGLSPCAEKSGVAWKPNGLRHSFVSYRLAQTRNEGQVALEMGNSPAMIFRHYRALVTPEQAEEWFGVHPRNHPEIPES